MKIPKIELKVTRKGCNTEEMYKVNTSLDASTVMRTLFDSNRIHWQEEAIMILLNNANNVIGYYKISAGGITGTVIDTRIVFGVALKSMATAIILAHNHPSGNIKPSTEDIRLTKKLVEAGKILDIALLDHLIITETGYLSMADEGLM